MTRYEPTFSPMANITACPRTSGVDYSQGQLCKGYLKVKRKQDTRPLVPPATGRIRLGHA